MLNRGINQSIRYIGIIQVILSITGAYSFFKLTNYSFGDFLCLFSPLNLLILCLHKRLYLFLTDFFG